MNKRVAFLTTRWTRVFHAGDPHHPHNQAAFTELFQDYWYPSYVSLRRKSGCIHEKAEDLLQVMSLEEMQRY